MIHTFASRIEAPRADVFAWHERPGALTRLLPPWQPIRVRAETSSLREGSAQLVIPPGLPLTSRHSGYQAPERFVDELTLPVLPWRHTHRFEPDGPDATWVVDEVDTPVPAALLRSAFAYRHRQLAADLAAHGRAAEWGNAPLTVAITGSSGLVGSALAAFLSTGGHRVVRLVRRPPDGPDERTWRPEAPDADMLRGVDAVVHLAGANINGRFTEEHKRAIRDSRVGPTRALAEAIARSDGGPRVLVSASGIHYYGTDRGEETLTEDSPRGPGFLADVVRDWEAATRPAADAGVRVVNVRTGVVQTPRGGALLRFYLLFQTGLGGRVGRAGQWTSWIAHDDLLDVYHRALLDEDLSGPVNACAPQAARNGEYAATLGRVLRRPALIPAPAFGPRLLLGAEGAETLAGANQRVLPARLLDVGHRFRYPQLEDALRHVTGHQRAPLVRPEELPVTARSE